MSIFCESERKRVPRKTTFCGGKAEPRIKVTCKGKPQKNESSAAVLLGEAFPKAHKNYTQYPIDIYSKEYSRLIKT